MTKAALKRKNARLIEKRDRMNELIEGNEQEIKELDSLESRELLEKFNIESEELAKLIYMRDKANKAALEAEDSEKPKTGRRSKDQTAHIDETVRPWDEADEEAEPEETNETEETEAPAGYDPLHMAMTRKEA